MAINENVNKNVVRTEARNDSRISTRIIRRARLERRGRTRRLPAEVAAAVGKAAMAAHTRLDLTAALENLHTGVDKAVDDAIADIRLAIKQRDSARIEAVQSLWAEPRLAMDRDFLAGALELMHPAEIRPFVPDEDAESFRILVGETWSGAAESRSDEGK